MRFHNKSFIPKCGMGTIHVGLWSIGGRVFGGKIIRFEIADIKSWTVFYHKKRLIDEPVRLFVWGSKHARGLFLQIRYGEKAVSAAVRSASGGPR